MTNKKNGSVKSGRAFDMTASEADFSIAALFYFQSKMYDPVQKERFEKTLLTHITEHSVTGLRRPYEEFGIQKKMPRKTVSTWTCSDNYLEKPIASRKSWLLTYANKIICNEKIDEQPNPYNMFFTPFADYMFSKKDALVDFAAKRPKAIVVTPDKKFDWQALFKPKSKNAKLLEQLSENVNTLLEMPFANAIHDYHEKECLQKLQHTIDAFSDSVEPIMQKWWNEQGLDNPVFKTEQKGPIAA